MAPALQPAAYGFYSPQQPAFAHPQPQPGFDLRVSANPNKGLARAPRLLGAGDQYPPLY